MLKITHNYKLCCWLNNWKFFMWQLSQIFIKFNFLGVFQNSQDEHNPNWNSNLNKISMRKTGKKSATSENAGLLYTVYQLSLWVLKYFNNLQRQETNWNINEVLFNNSIYLKVVMIEVKIFIQIITDHMMNLQSSKKLNISMHNLQREN